MEGVSVIFINRSPRKFSEGDFIESTEGMIFDVKGLIHPPDRVIAFIRYIPDPKGDRKRDNIRYRKVYDLDERLVFLRNHFPHYIFCDRVLGEELIEVPLENVVHHYSPRGKMAELRSRSDLTSLEAKALSFVDLIANSAHIPQSKIGVSGSILLGLASPSSDLDFVVYGAKNARKVDCEIKKLFEEKERFKKYHTQFLKTRHKDRCKESGVSFENYLFHEQRKSFEGFFDGTEFFVRYVKDQYENGEVYGEKVYAPMGRAKISGIVKDDSSALFTPCFYGVRDVKTIEGDTANPISGIASFRGRFCQQALTGERVVACGKVEQVIHNNKTNCRLIVGNRPEDFMVTVR